jgi:F0F1-type ATP synthase epsilon subunit
VLIGEAIPPDELDPAELRQRVEDAEQRLADAEEDSAAEQQAERDKARAEAFLEVAESR